MRASITIAEGQPSPVALPPIVAVGVTFPFAPAGYFVSVSLLRLATHRFPELSTASPYGPTRPVFAPEIVAIGVALPLAPGA